MSSDEVRALALSGAFWLALAGFAGRTGLGRHLVGLLAGGVCARLGWALLELPRGIPSLRLVVAPEGGLTVLALPLGPLLVARTVPPAQRAHFVRASFAALPLALALARLGCVANGCCGAPWLPRLEIGAFVFVHALIRSRRTRQVAPVVLAAFGVIRLCTEPFRPPTGASSLAVTAGAAAWIVVSLCMMGCAPFRRRRC